MRITDVRVVLHERQSELAVFGSSGNSMPMGVLRILTDTGVEGNSFLSAPGPGPAAVGQQIVTFLKPLLLGEDPLDIGMLWRRTTGMSHYVGPIAIGVVDVALWDIAGKVAGLPIHRLLGTCRDRVPVYISSGHHARAEDYVEEALYWQSQGWKGYKLHPARAPWRQGPRLPIQSDIDTCAAIRTAVGSEMTLMHDPSWSYSYTEALTVGRAIEELDYFWYEDPLPANDIHGYTRLRDHLRIPLLATEITRGGLYSLPEWIVRKATDFLRGDVVIKGGITGLMKIAHLAEAFGMNCEIHDGYNALNNVANLHVTMAIDNCEWFEVLTFNRAGQYNLEYLNYGLATPFEIDGEGFLHAPTRPGLGYDVDWELIRASPAGEIV